MGLPLSLSSLISPLGLITYLKLLETYQDELEHNGYGPITTEISMIKNYFLAEEYHQQYLAKNPNGYCGLGGTGCSFPNN